MLFPLPSTEGLEEAAHHDGSGGQGSSDRTLTGSATWRAWTLTPSPTPLLAGPSGDDLGGVTRRFKKVDYFGFMCVYGSVVDLYFCAGH